MLPAVLVVELGEASFSNPSGLGQGRPLLPSASRDQANMPLFLNLRTMPGRAQPPAEDRESKDGLGATLPGPARLTPRTGARGLCLPRDRPGRGARSGSPPLALTCSPSGSADSPVLRRPVPWLKQATPMYRHG